VTAVEGTHNNPLVLSGEGTMFGPVRDPVDNDVHDSEYSPFLDSRTFESSDMCGSCHDIVTDANVHIERTFTQWQDSFFSDADDLSGGPANYSLGCANCHGGLPEPGTIADYPGVKGDRTRHPHHMQAVDLALHPWPSAELGPQLQQTQRDEMERQRRGALCASICVTADAEGADVDVYLHNEFAAHAWPSGASQDRRAWLEVEAFAGDDALLSIGRVEDGEPVADIASPDLWQLRDYLYDEAGNEVHMFWEARSVDGETLPGAEILSPMGDASTWRVRRYRVDDPALDRVTTRVRLRPVGLDVLDSLIDSGDLDPALRAQMQTFDYPSTVLEWTPDNLDECDPDDARCPTYGECVSSNGIGCGAPLIGAPKPGQ
jgi:hypothetical protein